MCLPTAALSKELLAFPSVRIDTILKVMLCAGADPNSFSQVLNFGFRGVGALPLYAVSKRVHCNFKSSMISSGADVDAVDATGSGADVDAVDANGLTSPMLAVANGQSKAA